MCSWGKHDDERVVGDVTCWREREDQPQWKRSYKAAVPRGCTVTVSFRSYSFGRCDSSEIRQSNGKWVSFDVKNPADKILDRELLPDVERLCEEILRLDREFILSAPNEFTDETGTRWSRVE